VPRCALACVALRYGVKVAPLNSIISGGQHAYDGLRLLYRLSGGRYTHCHKQKHLDCRLRAIAIMET